jgi:quercetin dioxygenase-like cupin family protein
VFPPGRRDVVEAEAPQDPPVVRVVEFTMDLQPPLATARVEARRIRMASGVAACRHVHNGPVLGSVVRGTVLFQIAGQPSMLLRSGDVFCEPANVPIEHFDADDEEVEFIAFFALREDQAPETTFPG